MSPQLLLPRKPSVHQCVHTSRTRTRSFPLPYSLHAGPAHTSRTFTPHPRLPDDAAGLAQRLGTSGAGEPTLNLAPFRERNPCHPFSSVGASDAWGTARVRGTPPHHRAPPPSTAPPYRQLSLPPSGAHPQLLRQRLFPKRSWRPEKDEPGGGGGDAHAQREDAAPREWGKLELAFWQLGLEKWLSPRKWLVLHFY